MILAALVAALTFLPVGAPVGTPVVAHASQLAANTSYTLVWYTGAARWQAGDGRFSGIVAPEVSHPIATGTSDAGGALTLRFRVPEDFGYVHNVELQADGTAVATQGFTVIPKLTISPASGPLGTPITITMTGVGYRFYQAVWHLMYDSGQVGWLSAITTHGTARVTIPATGALGIHTLQAIEGPTAPYLNEAQSPNYQPLIPTVIAQHFRITAGPPHLPPPAVAQLPARALDPIATTGTATLALNYASGPVGSALALDGRGFAPQTKIAIGWQTIVGNDISGNGWQGHERALATVTTDASGAFHATAPTPDDVGGDHHIVAREVGGTTEATTTYNLVPSVVGYTAHAKPGAPIAIHLKGGGWGETGNIYTVVIDNAYFGYACGFNSQGDIAIAIYAPGTVGWHFIDLYPAIYNGKITGPGAPPPTSESNGSYFLLPMLNVRDHPGEQLPAFHLALEVR
jgi:hypothetical protein